MSLFATFFTKGKKEEPVAQPPARDTRSRHEQIEGMMVIDPNSAAAAEGAKFFKITALKAQLKAVDGKINKAALTLKEQQAKLAELDTESLAKKDIIRLRSDSKVILGRLEVVRFQVLAGSEVLSKEAAPGTLSEFQRFTQNDDDEGFEELKAAAEELSELNLGNGLNLNDEVSAKVAQHNEKLTSLRALLQGETVNKTKREALKHLAQLSSPVKEVVEIADREIESLSEDTIPADRTYTKQVASKKLLIAIARTEEALKGFTAQRDNLEAEIALLEK